jgi:hypothetical protein
MRRSVAPSDASYLASAAGQVLGGQGEQLDAANLTQVRFEAREQIGPGGQIALRTSLPFARANSVDRIS